MSYIVPKAFPSAMAASETSFAPILSALEVLLVKDRLIGRKCFYLPYRNIVYCELSVRTLELASKIYGPSIAMIG